MDADRIKWNRRFASEDSFLGVRPSPFLSREIDRIKLLVPGNRALDIACGEGRNSVFLAQNGFQVTGLDISDVGLSKAIGRAETAGLTIDFIQTNLKDYCIPEKFDLILNFNFLLRELIHQEVQALNPGGLLLFDTILEPPQLQASHNPAYFLKEGELHDIFKKYCGEILFSEESTAGDMPTARLMFRKNQDI